MITEQIPITLTLPPSKTPRSAGVHVSSIIRCIALEMKILKAELAEDLSLTDVREITDPVAVLRICIGLAWEEWYLPQLDGVIDHPGEMQLEGIFMTHDGESVDTILTEKGPRYTSAVHEIKATYKSLRTVADLESQWMWLTQVRAYCKALNTRVAYLHVLFLCGDYQFPITPQLRCWRIEFTQEEIDENWALITDYLKHRQALEGQTDDITS